MWTRIRDMDQMIGAMDLLHSRMNRLYTVPGSSYGQDYGSQGTEETPMTNLYDTGDTLIIKTEVPGIAKENLNIKIQGNYLELSGTRESEAPEGYKAHRIERDATTFTRSFTLPSDVDGEKGEASLHNGILSLSLPKAEEAKPKQVVIK